MEWSRGPTIGRGSSATVSVAASTAGDLFAVKSAELSRSSLLQKEQQFLSQLSSPHIVQYKGFEITSEFNNPTYNLFMEYIPGGSISDKIKKEGGLLDELTIQLYTRQILIGLDYLHLNGLVHCDIKGENLLLGENGVKIADLGCAKRVEDTSAISGTPAFMAPEVARGEKQGFEADVWALGCTIIEMATGSHPWPESNNPVSTLYRIGFSGDVPEPPAWFSDEATDFLSKCLERDCEERWTAQQLMKHPFLEQVFDSNSDSPISVLDQGFWESLEESEDQRNSTHVSSSSNSPTERITSLISSDLPNWDWDEDWVTVRNKDIEESSVTVEQNDRELIIPADSYMVSDVGLEDVGNSSVAMNEDLSTDISADTIVGGGVDCNYDSTDFLVLFGNDENVIVLVILDLKRRLMEVMLFLQRSLPFLSHFTPFFFLAVSLKLLGIHIFFRSGCLGQLTRSSTILLSGLVKGRQCTP
ncbi:hypothetical protein RHGRI_018665 [Rhododendron griersonianum]|uniref:Protein kinase domain-containing protein n=1 Tax=Rhododendron griersonianum TaxID=479676 RepID=A0AAV6K2D1_9ERIC|nr:hypothetical protein RHGRI_018665 [Rhododendron griersonianum]